MHPSQYAPMCILLEKKNVERADHGSSQVVCVYYQCTSMCLLNAQMLVELPSWIFLTASIVVSAHCTQKEWMTI